MYIALCQFNAAFFIDSENKGSCTGLIPVLSEYFSGKDGSAP